MTLLGEAFAGYITGKNVPRSLGPLPPALDRLSNAHHELVRQIGQSDDINRFFFLGSGHLYGVANEGMLKIKEMSLSYSEAFHTLEFHHRPMSMIDEKTLVIGLFSNHIASQEFAVLSQMRDLGARVLILAEASPPEFKSCCQIITLESNVEAWARTVLYLPLLQLLAYYKALARKQNPDKPKNLDAVVHLEP